LLAIQAPILIDAINIKDGCWEFFYGGSTLKRTCNMQTIQNNSFANLPSNITTLGLSLNQVKTIESQAFVGCEHLRQLDLGNNQITGLPQNVFEPLPNIKVIWLSFNQLSNFSFDVFANNQNLEKVYLNHNKMTALVPIQHKSDFSIKKLDLRYNDLKNISEVCKLQKLEIFELGFNWNLDFTTFKFSCWTQLRELNLFATNFKSLNYDYRLFIGLNKLKILILGDNNLEMLCVGNFPELLELEKLNVDYNNMKIVNAQELIRKFPKLNRFDMRGNPWDCNNFENLKKTFKALEIEISFGFPTCDPLTKTNETDLNSCPIYNEQIHAPFTNHSLINFALQMVMTLILFIADISVSIYFYVIESNCQN
jgi:Leucine-rich repeat (LRR) protein